MATTAPTLNSRYGHEVFLYREIWRYNILDAYDNVRTPNVAFGVAIFR